MRHPQINLRNDSTSPYIKKYLRILGVATTIQFQKIHQYFKVLEKLRSPSIGWACCFGIFMVLGGLVWLALWISGTYFSIVAFESARVHQWSENVDKRTFLACDSATLAVAGFCLAFIWILSAIACVQGIVSVFVKQRTEYREVVQD